ncbi:MAG: 2-oxoisovalerate dehydrogenase [Bacteroidetes bacterium]|nr:2-oxoisovalerate dehydrogenase [Bacteroidota bacterium]
MNEIIFLVEEDEVDGGLNARALGEAIFTFGKDKVELLKNIREAVDVHFDEGTAPKIIRLHYVHEEVYES